MTAPAAEYPHPTSSQSPTSHTSSAGAARPPSSPQPQHCKHKHDSKVSLSTNSSAKSHQQYLDSLIAPTQAMVDRIAEVQVRKEGEVMARRLRDEERLCADGEGHLDESEREKAAGLIQRNYRGHRERRMLAGMSLDPSSRWVEAIKEAQYRNLTQPRKRADLVEASTAINGNVDGVAEGRPKHGRSGSSAMQHWRKVGMITRRAGGDEDSNSESEDEVDTPLEEREARRKRKVEQKAERQKAAKLMDLQYFLEMVDLKHRYGSNLRTYHEEWKEADTNENFFYWLDYGEGRFLDCQGCPRERLEREQVRYLSKEERLDYLVKIDKEGRLCWAKTGARIDTTERFKDSIHGIVPVNDETPAYTPASAEAAHDHGHTRRRSRTTSTSSSSSDDESDEELSDRANKYATPDFDKSKGIKKIRHVSAATIFNKLLRGSVKKNTWIFVADTSFRLYVGIKQSGAFQHSSFLHGSRISAAGLIKIKNGRLAKLSPLSGHYRPPVSNFRAFVHSLKDHGVDMSHVSTSHAYAVLVGLEAYVKTRRRGKNFMQKLLHHRDKLLSPVEVAEQEEAARDKSESAAKEQKFLNEKAEAEEKAREENRVTVAVMDKLHIRPKTTSHGEAPVGETKPHEKDPDIQAPGTGPENAITPGGRRDT